MIGKLLRQPWVFSVAAAIAVWLITITYTGGQGAGAILTAALSFATFTIIVGLGQMMVITTGPTIVESKAGECAFIDTFIKGLLYDPNHPAQHSFSRSCSRLDNQISRVCHIYFQRLTSLSR
jgi:hypothetical protein